MLGAFIGYWFGVREEIPVNQTSVNPADIVS